MGRVPAMITKGSDQRMNASTQAEKRVLILSSLVLLILAVPIAVGISGCRNSGGITAAKDGQKFPAVTPPADYIADREKRRRNAAPPGPPRNPPPAPGTK